MRDMDLGSAEDPFQVVYEEEVNPRRLEEEVVDPNPEANVTENVDVDVGNVAQDEKMMDENNLVVIGLGVPGAGGVGGNQMDFKVEAAKEN